MLTNRYLTDDDILNRFVDSVNTLLDEIKKIREDRKKDTPRTRAHYVQKAIDKWFIDNGH